MFNARFLLQMGRVHFGCVQLPGHSGKSQPGEFSALGRGIHHAHTGQYERADDEDQDCVVQKIHVHEPANRAGIVEPSLLEQLEEELKTELIAPMSAASRAAIMSPTSPAGSRFTIKVG